MSSGEITLDPNGVLPERKKKETFGSAQPKKKNNTGKKVAPVVAAAILTATAIIVPTVIQMTSKSKVDGYKVTINYGYAGGVKSLNLKKGSKVGDITAPEVDGYYFEG